jgi:hypothetical protein
VVLERGRREGKISNLGDRPLAGHEDQTGTLPLARANRAGVFGFKGVIAARRETLCLGLLPNLFDHYSIEVTWVTRERRKLFWGERMGHPKDDQAAGSRNRRDLCGGALGAAGGIAWVQL